MDDLMEKDMSELGDKASGIYKITNSVTGKVYIGSSVKLWKRRQMHFWQLNCNEHYNKHLQCSYRKYGGECFVFEVIEHCPADALIQREQAYIDLYDAYNTGYNQSPASGSPLGVKRSEEYKRQQSECRKGRKLSPEARRKTILALIGRPVSEVTREKLRVAHTGKVLSVEHKVKLSNAVKGKPWSVGRREAQNRRDANVGTR